MCVYLAEEEEDVLALAGMRQTAVGQYLRGMRWMDGGWVRGQWFRRDTLFICGLNCQHSTPET